MVVGGVLFWGIFFSNAPLLKYPGNAPGGGADSAGEHKGRLKPSVEETVLRVAAAREIIRRANPV